MAKTSSGCKNLKLKLMKSKVTIIIAALALMGCNKNTEVSQEPVHSQEGVFATAMDFTGFTKTVIDGDGQFSWKEGDVIGVVPADNQTVQSNYTIAEISANPKSARFDGGAWALKEGKDYIAYYPYQSVVLTSDGQATLSFTGQTQAGKNDTGHIGAYDYMYAEKVSPSEGNAIFTFKHKISLVRIVLTVPETATYTKLTFSCTDAVFAESATMAIADGSLALGTKRKSISLGLDNLSLSKGEELVAWLSVCPNDFGKEETFTAILAGSDNKTYHFNFDKTLSGFSAGSAYAFAGDLIVFEDDFEWINPFALTSNAGDSVGTNNPSATSPNVYTSVTGFVTEFNNRGYDYFWSKQDDTEWHASNDNNANVLYINQNYLKFGKTSYNAGLILPALDKLDKKSDVVIEFDFCFQITGGLVLDTFNLQVESSNGTFDATGSNVSEDLRSAQPGTESRLEWQHAKVVLKDANASTVLRIRPEFTDPYKSETTTKCNRFFLDNIRITRR